MKHFKLFFLLIITLVLRVNVAEAKTYYSDYSDYSEYTEDKVDETDTTYVESKKLYHAYIEKYKRTYLRDKTDYYTGGSVLVYKDWTFNKEDLDISMNYIESDYYYYKKYLGTNNFEFRNDGTSTLKLTNICVTSKMICDSLDYETLTLKPGAKFKFQIDELDIMNFNITFNLYLLNDGDNSLKIDFLNSDKTIFYSYDVDLEEENNLYEIKDFYNIDSLFEDKIFESLNKDFVGNIVEIKKIYRNYYYLYESNVPYKEYLDLYLESSDEYKLDYDDFKIMYRYKTRDKVEIKDDIKIDNYDQKLEDFIISTTIDNSLISIKSDIDYKLNGKYIVNYILPFKNIKKEVTLDIKDNYINLIKKEEEYIKELYQVAEESTYKVDKKNLEIKEVINDYEEEIKELNELIDSYKYKLKTCEKSVSKEDEIDNKYESFGIISLVSFFIFYITISKIVERRKMKKTKY